MELLLDRAFQSPVVVADHQIHIPQPSRLQFFKKRTPAFLAFSVRDREPEHFATSLCVHTDRDQESLGPDPVILPHFHVDRIRDHEGIVPVQ
ncbi:MAG: hypothetical protein BWY82_02940 [Verrucomicrobia bacterium ADurb.Bin474]|nr:MAG: hypothetical protein BWY82_02940 [Verrucomicrobia bacterium ADurb.Bin474]